MKDLRVKTIKNGQEGTILDLIKNDTSRKRYLITHSGTFHAHEVAQATLLWQLFNQLTVYRTRNKEFIDSVIALKEPTVYVHDVGMVSDPSNNVLDHHQEGFEYHGLRTMFFCHPGTNTPVGAGRLMNSSTVEIVLDNIAMLDNGLDATDIANSFISSFNPAWHRQEEDSDTQFHTAMEVMLTILQKPMDFMRIATRLNVMKEGQGLAIKTLDLAIGVRKDNYIILETFVPWHEYVINYNKSTDSPVEFVIYPDQTGLPRLQAVNKTIDSFELLKPIVATAGEDGCTFVHPNKFIAGFNTITDCIKAAQRSHNGK